LLDGKNGPHAVAKTWSVSDVRLIPLRSVGVPAEPEVRGWRGLKWVEGEDDDPKIMNLHMQKGHYVVN